MVALKGSKSAAITSLRSSTVTVTAYGNAVGSNIPPVKTFTDKRNSPELAQKCIPGTSVRISETGLSNNTVYVESQFKVKHGL